jgi:hypothetical protein
VPTTVVLLIVSAAPLLFVTVTVFAGLVVPTAT